MFKLPKYNNLYPTHLVRSWMKIRRDNIVEFLQTQARMGLFQKFQIQATMSMMSTTDRPVSSSDGILTEGRAADLKFNHIC